MTTNDQLATFQRQHGQRVRRAAAMALLDISTEKTFRKVVDANPELRHRLSGERQWKYRTAEIFALLHPPTRCATRGEEQ